MNLLYSRKVYNHSTPAYRKTGLDTMNPFEYFIRECGISEEIYRQESNFTTALRFAGNRVLDNIGLIGCFGDAFQYRDMAVLVLGHSGSGKTGFVNECLRKARCEKLAEDDILMLRNPKAQVLRYPYLETQNWAETASRYMQYLSTAATFPLKMVIHLNVEDGFSEYFAGGGDPRSIRKYFYTMRGQARREDDRLISFLEGIPILEYFKNYGYRDYRHLCSVHNDIWSALGSHLAQRV